MLNAVGKTNVLLECLPYIQDFRSSIIVIKLGGSLMEDELLIESTLRDIVLMECIGMHPVIVHGGGKAINAKLQEIGIPLIKTQGMRHTCKTAIKIVDDVLHNEVNTHLVSVLQKHQAKVASLSGKNVLKASKLNLADEKTGKRLDIGFVGEVNKVDTAPIIEMINNKIIPVITPLGSSQEGDVYNINADIAAAKIAESLKANKLVYLSDVPGVLEDPQDKTTLISTLTKNEVHKLIESKIIAGGMLPKILSALEALYQGINKVHLIDGCLPHALLLELFTDGGIGTQIIH